MQEPRQWRPGILCIPDCVELTDVAFSDDGSGIVAASESALLRWALPEWKLCVSPFNRTRLAVSGSTLVTIRRCPEHSRRACPAITTADATFKCTFCPPKSEGLLRAAEARSVAASKAIPEFDTLDRGGIVGAAEILDVLPPGDSGHKWHMKPDVTDSPSYGFLLGRRIALPFRPFRGALGFFNVELTPTEARALRAAGLVPSRGEP